MATLEQLKSFGVEKITHKGKGIYKVKFESGALCVGLDALESLLRVTTLESTQQLEPSLKVVKHSIKHINIVLKHINNN